MGVIHRLWIVFAVAFINTIPAFGQTVTPAKPAALHAKGVKALPVRAVGRVSAKALPAAMPKGAIGYTHQWPAVYFEAAFTGDSFLLKFDDVLNEYRLFIDDGKPITMAQPGSAVFKVSGLPRKAHRLRLEKVTESIGNVGAFQGFYIGRGSQIGLSTSRQRQIEFIGDSGMAGYGLRSTKRECTKEEVRLLTDSQNSYPALTAKHFGADYQVNAYSGRGVIRNYDGFEPGVTMPALYPYVLYDKKESYGDPAWKPQIVVVGLGANDLSTPLKPGEKWQTAEQFAQDFLLTYGKFLGAIHVGSPDAALIVVWPNADEISNAETAQYARLGKTMLEAEANRLGFRAVAFLAMDDLKLEYTACDYHASVQDHRKVTEVMTKFLESKPELWGK